MTIGPSLAAADPPPKPVLAEMRIGARNERILADGKFSGAGADMLGKRVAESRFALIGEDHFTHEIPSLTSAICDVMHPDAFAAETGPQAAQFVTGLLRSPDRPVRMRESMKEYAHDLTFLDQRTSRFGSA